MLYKNQGTYQTQSGTQGFGGFQSPIGAQGAGNPQAQMGQQMGNYVNPNYLGREQQIVQETHPQTWYHPGNQIGETIAQPQRQQGGFHTEQQNVFQTGQQTGYQTGQQTGFQTGQPAFQPGQQAARFGANELMMVHEILTDTIDGINQFELYRQHVKDQQLMQIVDNQINYMFNGYNKLVGYLHNQGAGSVVPYRATKSSSVKYGLRQPSSVQPNTSINEMDDRDVASGMMGCHKSSACLRMRGTLECADPTLRSMLTNCAVSSSNMAYEVFQYMNQKGMYQVPTLASQTTQTMMGMYQNVQQPSVR